MNLIIFGTVMCLHSMTNQETGEKSVQVELDCDDANVSVICSRETARQYFIGAKISLTLEVLEDVRH